MLKRFLFLFLVTPLWAETPQAPAAPVQTPVPIDEHMVKKESRVPIFRQFVRTFDVEGGAHAAGNNRVGAQFVRIETRYLDPDEQAFVGLIGSLSRFNTSLRLGEADELTTSRLIGNWGANMGIVRGRHLWALDLMGANLGNHLAFAPAIVGEHQITSRWALFHRTTLNLFIGDQLLDSDQGVIWSPWETVGFTLGYRIFAAKHLNRNGPRAGLLLHFKSPKIPFLFPSLG